MGVKDEGNGDLNFAQGPPTRLQEFAISPRRRYYARHVKITIWEISLIDGWGEFCCVVPAVYAITKEVPFVNFQYHSRINFRCLSARKTVTILYYHLNP
jgi:hypothetical protein